MFRILQASKINCAASRLFFSNAHNITSTQQTPNYRVLRVYNLTNYRFLSSKKKDSDSGEECSRDPCGGAKTGSTLSQSSGKPCPPSVKKVSGKTIDPTESHMSQSQGHSPASKLKLRKCKPISISPCKPIAPGAYTKIPSLNEANRPNLLNECPEPLCQWEEANKRQKSYYGKILMLGLLFTAATLGALAYVGLWTEPKNKVEKPKAKSKLKKQGVVRIPSNADDIPREVPYLLIGGGTASFSAFRAIKSADPLAKVLVVSNESFYPYMRPPLSKEMWFNDDPKAVKKLMFKQWNGSERSLYYEPEDFYSHVKLLSTSENGGVSVLRGWSVDRVDVVNKTAFLDDGTAVKYNKCLIATGATPKKLSVFEALEDRPEVSALVNTFRSINDFQEVYENFSKAKTVAIIGGGFLGSELACALARKAKKEKRSQKVLQIFKEAGNMGKILPEYLSFWTTDKIKAEGVEVITNTEVTGVNSEKNALLLTLSNGQDLKVDQVIVAVGVTPNTDLAEKSDLEVDPELGGYLVNTELMARSHLYIAGDCACFFDAKLGRRRIEHHDHAVVSGRLAGENMAGGVKPYLHQSMFWSDLGPDVGYEAIGVVDSNLPTVGVFAKATDSDNPKAVVTATDEGIRSKTEEEVPKVCEKYLKQHEVKKQCEAAKSSRQESSKPLEGEDFGKGVVFYLRDDIVVGIVLWNVFNRMSVARQVLQDNNKYDDLNEVAKLFNIHEE